MAKRTNRVVWGLVVVLGVLLLAGSVVLLSPYGRAKYRGQGADLRNFDPQYLGAVKVR